MIYARELIYEVSVYLFNVLHETYAFLFSIAMFIIAYYKLKDVSNSYLEIQDRYVMGKTGFNQQKIDLLFDKLMLVIVFAFFALFVIEVVFYVKLANIEHLFDSLYILSLFVGINLILFLPSLFLFRRPVVLEYEKNRYAEWRLKVPSYFDDKDVIFALSSNAWLLQKFALNKDYYELFDSFAPEHGKAFRKLFIKYINRLDENFLGEVKILRSLLDSKNTFFSLKHMEKLVNTNMTAQEVYDYYVKLEASKSKIFKIVDFVIDLIGKIVISICYPFKRIWYWICAFFQSIANFYTFLVDTFHKMCPYSNASERI